MTASIFSTFLSSNLCDFILAFSLFLSPRTREIGAWIVLFQSPIQLCQNSFEKEKKRLKLRLVVSSLKIRSTTFYKAASIRTFAELCCNKQALVDPTSPSKLWLTWSVTCKLVPCLLRLGRPP
uniref:Uncharacterized protein n=2 Tax=Panagrolaimus sp. ES5 TaxID=591445 RepID=A0AC34GDA9_9BILA